MSREESVISVGRQHKIPGCPRKLPDLGRHEDDVGKSWVGKTLRDHAKESGRQWRAIRQPSSKAHVVQTEAQLEGHTLW